MANLFKIQDFYSKLVGTTAPAEHSFGQFNVFKLEELSIPDQKPLSYSRRDYYKVSLISGHNKLHYADQSFEITGPALVFTNPMIPYQWEPMNAKQTGFVCIFKEVFFNQMDNLQEYPVFRSASHSIISLDGEDFDFYNSLFIRMYREIQGNYLYKYELLRGLMTEIIHEAQKKQPAVGNPYTGSNSYERITLLFAELLERQFPIDIGNPRIKFSTPSAFAGQLNIHVNHLNKVLRETTSETTSQLIGNRIIQEAKILLKTTSHTINEIAWCLGFDEPNHFSTFFKSRTGVAPRQFRQAAID